MYFVPVADPVAGSNPSDQIRNFVFMSNLAAQETTGEKDSSVSVERIVNDLIGSAETTSQLFLATTENPANSEAFYEAEGWIMFSFPLIDDRSTASFDIVLDATHLPLPGERISDGARHVIKELLSFAEHTSRAYPWRRQILQTAHTHSSNTDDIVCEYCALLACNGYHRVHEHIQQIIHVEPRAWSAPGYVFDAVYGTDFPKHLIDGVIKLYDIAAIDVPHGKLSVDPMPWTAERLAKQSDHINSTGSRIVSALLSDPEGVVALSTIVLPPCADTTSAEQSLSIVHPRVRGKKLGLAVKLACLELIQKRYPQLRKIATSNAVDNQAILAINRRIGSREISRTSLWEKSLMVLD